jgi:hypothetical protein
MERKKLDGRHVHGGRARAETGTHERLDEHAMLEPQSHVLVDSQASVKA